MPKFRLDTIREPSGTLRFDVFVVDYVKRFTGAPIWKTVKSFSKKEDALAYINEHTPKDTEHIVSTEFYE